MAGTKIIARHKRIRKFPGGGFIRPSYSNMLFYGWAWPSRCRG